MAIKYCTLPIKPGYVEVEIDGIRTYRNIETMQLIDDEIIIPSIQRENAYNNDKIIEWENNLITVDEANKIYYNYFVENNPKAEEIQILIIAAKSDIREMYPNVD